MTRNTTIFVTLATLTAMSSAASGGTLAFSSFDTGDEGWTAQAGPGAPQYTTNWNPTGGTPTGHIQYQDATSNDAEWFAASAGFLGNGDFSSAIGNGGVSFDWSADYAPSAVNVQIAFVGGNQILWTETLASVGTGWNAYDFAFDLTTAWMMTDNNTNTTNAATTGDMYSVLSSVDGLYITGDILYGMDGTCSLDSPRIYSVPAPGALALLGVASIVGTRRRRQTA